MSLVDQLVERMQLRRHTKTRELGFFDALSFVIYGILSVLAMVIIPTLFWLLVATLTVDGLATVFRVDSLISAGRSLFFFMVVVASILIAPYALAFLAFEVLFLVAVLDLSFFLRRLDDTSVDFSVVKGRLRSYAFTVLPAFLLSYALIYLYYLIPSFPSESAMLLGASAVGVFIVIYVVVHYISSLKRNLKASSQAIS